VREFKAGQRGAEGRDVFNAIVLAAPELIKALEMGAYAHAEYVLREALSEYGVELVPSEVMTYLAQAASGRDVQEGR
jgi:hypothetical protein